MECLEGRRRLQEARGDKRAGPAVAMALQGDAQGGCAGAAAAGIAGVILSARGGTGRVQDSYHRHSLGFSQLMVLGITISLFPVTGPISGGCALTQQLDRSITKSGFVSLAFTFISAAEIPC